MEMVLDISISNKHMHVYPTYEDMGYCLGESDLCHPMGEKLNSTVYKQHVKCKYKPITNHYYVVTEDCTSDSGSTSGSWHFTE